MIEPTPLENARRITQLRAEALKDAQRYGPLNQPVEIGPAYGRPNRDGPYAWQWGITNSDLISKMQ
jgi:hypothetical protein